MIISYLMEERITVNMYMALSAPKTIITRVAETAEISEVTVLRVLDDAQSQEVLVWVEGVPQAIKLGGLSGENYNNPPWTDELIVQHVEAFIESL
jgi:hypothetical protein